MALDSGVSQDIIDRLEQLIRMFFGNPQEVAEYRADGDAYLQRHNLGDASASEVDAAMSRVIGDIDPDAQGGLAAYRVASFEDGFTSLKPPGLLAGELRRESAVRHLDHITNHVGKVPGHAYHGPSMTNIYNGPQTVFARGGDGGDSTVVIGDIGRGADASISSRGGDGGDGGDSRGRGNAGDGGDGGDSTVITGNIGRGSNTGISSRGGDGGDGGDSRGRGNAGDGGDGGDSTVITGNIGRGSDTGISSRGGDGGDGGDSRGRGNAGDGGDGGDSTVVTGNIGRGADTRISSRAGDGGDGGDSRGRGDAGDGGDGGDSTVVTGNIGRGSDTAISSRAGDGGDGGDSRGRGDAGDGGDGGDSTVVTGNIGRGADTRISSRAGDGGDGGDSRGRIGDSGPRLGDPGRIGDSAAVSTPGVARGGTINIASRGGDAGTGGSVLGTGPTGVGDSFAGVGKVPPSVQAAQASHPNVVEAYETANVASASAFSAISEGDVESDPFVVSGDREPVEAMAGDHDTDLEDVGIDPGEESADFEAPVSMAAVRETGPESLSDELDDFDSQPDETLPPAGEATETFTDPTTDAPGMEWEDEPVGTSSTLDENADEPGLESGEPAEPTNAGDTWEGSGAAGEWDDGYGDPAPAPESEPSYQAPAAPAAEPAAPAAEPSYEPAAPAAEPAFEPAAGDSGGGFGYSPAPEPIQPIYEAEPGTYTMADAGNEAATVDYPEPEPLPADTDDGMQVAQIDGGLYQEDGYGSQGA